MRAVRPKWRVERVGNETADRSEGCQVGERAGERELGGRVGIDDRSVAQFVNAPQSRRRGGAAHLAHIDLSIAVDAKAGKAVVVVHDRRKRRYFVNRNGMNADSIPIERPDALRTRFAEK